MSVDSLVSNWRDVRDGLIAEVEAVPADKFDFKSAPETRSVAELIQHIIQTQKVLVGEMCRPDTNLMRQPFPELIKHYASEVRGVNDKEGLIRLLRESQDWCESTLRAFGDEALKAETRRFDGKVTTKIDFLTFSVGHEMYHRGQLTVYERLLGIEPALTIRFKKMFAQKS